METQEQSRFTSARLPWIVAGAAFIVFALTLNRWVSLPSLPVVGYFVDPNRMTPLSGPIWFLLTYPVHALPSSLQLSALSLISAICGALALGLLARSVALLPHDRTREQRARETSEYAVLSLQASWAPPLVAALIGGLQLSFWESATSATPDTLSLLLFAYVIRCLLEYRITERESWLTRMALVYGLATTENYAMVAYFPLFLGALIWIKGRDFFRGAFLLRMLGWGAAGLTLYLLLPLLSSLDPNTGLGFWQALRFELAAQKAALLAIPRFVVLLGALTTLVPVILIGIRWPASFGDTSAIGSLLANSIFRVVFLLLLAAGVWVAFDAPFSPRSLMIRFLGPNGEVVAGLQFLTLYYLGALAIGYFFGYFLLLFSRTDERARRRSGGGSPALSYAGLAVTWLALVGVPVGLAWRNLPSIRTNDGTLLREYATLSTQSLSTPSIALVDTPQILALTQILLGEQNRTKDVLLVDTRLLTYPVYQDFLHQRAPDRWPDWGFSTNRASVIDSPFLMYEVSNLALSNALYYLHPSFGFYFEPLYMVPNGLVYRLNAYRTNDIDQPRLPDAVLQENDAFWARLKPRLDHIAALIPRNSADARTVGRWYARALNFWGVTLQQADRFAQATPMFELARRLNPDNASSELNLAYNRSRLAGKPQAIDLAKSYQDRFGSRYRTWDALIGANGPVDDPAVCVALGRQLADQGLSRQATIQFLRALALDPGRWEAALLLANAYLTVGLNDNAIETLRRLRALETSAKWDADTKASLEVEIARLEAAAFRAKEVNTSAEKVLRDALARHPKSVRLLEALTELYLATERYNDALGFAQQQITLNRDRPEPWITQALIYLRLKQTKAAAESIGQALRVDPNNPQALLTQSALFIQEGDYTNAIPPLNRLLQKQPRNRAALLNRAIAQLQSGQLDPAERDYLALLPAMPRTPSILYGLGEIAFRRKDTPKAIDYYQAYLQFAPPNTEEAQAVSRRLGELKSGQR